MDRLAIFLLYKLLRTILDPMCPEESSYPDELTF